MGVELKCFARRYIFLEAMGISNGKDVKEQFNAKLLTYMHLCFINNNAVYFPTI